jgi:hypothetical protein
MPKRSGEQEYMKIREKKHAQVAAVVVILGQSDMIGTAEQWCRRSVDTLIRWAPLECNQSLPAQEELESEGMVGQGRGSVKRRGVDQYLFAHTTSCCARIPKRRWIEDGHNAKM